MGKSEIKNRTNINNLVAGLQLTEEEVRYIQMKDIGDRYIYGVEVTVHYRGGSPAWKESMGGFGEAFATDFFWKDFENAGLEFQLKHNNQHYSGKAGQYGCHRPMRAVIEIYSDRPIEDSTLIKKTFESLHKTFAYPSGGF